MSGVVTTVAATPGTFFPGGTSLLTILDESTIIVHAELPLAYLNQVSIGQSATVTPSALPNLQLTGKVTTIIPQATLRPIHSKYGYQFQIRMAFSCQV